MSSKGIRARHGRRPEEAAHPSGVHGAHEKFDVQAPCPAFGVVLHEGLLFYRTGLASCVIRRVIYIYIHA